jgi:hypothetical protein
MRTSFHQPEAQHPNFPLSTSWQADYPILETKGYIKRSSQSPSMQDILYEITDAGKAALRAVGGAAE